MSFLLIDRSILRGGPGASLARNHPGSHVLTYAPRAAGPSGRIRRAWNQRRAPGDGTA